MGHDRGGGLLSRTAARPARLGPRTDQLGRVGVEPEADLAAALFYERREPIRKRLQYVSRP
jgi:hypothetical protein